MGAAKAGAGAVCATSSWTGGSQAPHHTAPSNQPAAQGGTRLTLPTLPAARRPQVYKARLRSTGEQVAVKVQRPGIGDSIAVDMVLLRRLVALVDKNVPQVGGWAGRPMQLSCM